MSRKLKSFQLDQEDEQSWKDFVILCQLKGIPAYKRLMQLVQKYIAEEDPLDTLRKIGK
uniref:Uncharacterized protein n=1 Tax=viral metagenome TaxID=1070528 RepID=A0A6M3LL69_9ZZZZ